MKPALTLRRGADMYPITTSPSRIGRDAENDVALADESLSRRHAVVHLHGGRWRIEDEESANGVFVNGVRVQRAVLHAGDRIRLGAVEFEAVMAPLSYAKLALALAACVVLAGLGFFAAWPRASVPSTQAALAMAAPKPLPPPMGMTASEALRLAQARLADGARSGASLAEARRLAGWAAVLGAPPDAVATLRGDVDERLEALRRRGSYAYLRAVKLGRAAEAEAAMRVLRETFPADDPRSRDVAALGRR